MDMNDPLVVRNMMHQGDEVRDAGLTTPDNIVRYDDIQYGEDEKWNKLDVYHLEGVSSPQPTIVSIHGGGWVYGDKERYQYYCMNLAQRGFTVVNFTYRLAPEFRFPSPIIDTNNVFSWIGENAEKYNIDKNNLFVVGDSAGGQLGSQYLALFTNEEFRKLFDIEFPVDKVKIKGAALNCGAYYFKEQIMSGQSGFLTAYIDKDDETQMKQIDTLKYITDKFPPTFVMTSSKDFLRDQGQPFADLLKSHGVPCEFKLYGRDDEEQYQHVFHCNIKTEEAKVCNDDECDFFKSLLK